MRKEGQYFLIFLLLVLFMLLYVYTFNYRKEHFSQEQDSFILPSDKLAIIQGSMLPPDPPIKPVAAWDKDPSAPPLDGDKKSESQMFMFAFNKSHPDCCPSPYSNSQGCVCMTDKQLDWIGNRGVSKKCQA